MAKFSKISRDRLATCHVDLQKVMNAAIKRSDFSILCGHRGAKEQNDAFERGTSQLKWPKSKHNKKPSLAVDCAPYPIDWNNIARFIALADIVLDEAKKLGIKIRWGADWNRNGKWQDEKFRDWPHFELDN